MKKRRILLALLALALAMTVTLPAAMAYFTTYTRAAGSLTLELGGTTTIEETFAEWKKTVTIKAEDGSQPMWVRARAYSKYPLGYTGDGWIDGNDGWYYYSTPLANYEGQPADTLTTEAGQLVIEIKDVKVPVGEIPADFEVPVVYETAPVLYNADGSRVPCDDPRVWSQNVTQPGQNEGGETE